MIDPLLAAIEKERRALEARLEVLDEMERKVRRAPRPAGVVIVAPRAPWGHLRSVILKALGKNGPSTSAALKRSIKQSGYEYNISGQYFTKTLTALVGERKVRKAPNGGYSTYELA